MLKRLRLTGLSYDYRYFRKIVQIQAVLESFPELRQAYMLKEKFWLIPDKTHLRISVYKSWSTTVSLSFLAYKCEENRETSLSNIHR